MLKLVIAPIGYGLVVLSGVLAVRGVVALNHSGLVRIPWPISGGVVALCIFAAYWGGLALLLGVRIPEVLRGQRGLSSFKKFMADAGLFVLAGLALLFTMFLYLDAQGVEGPLN